MNPGIEYRIKAAELFALASQDHYRALRIQFEHLARAYLRLAEQADRNSQLDLAYETPPTTALRAQRGTPPYLA
jgi:hypothetical protein